MVVWWLALPLYKNKVSVLEKKGEYMCSGTHLFKTGIFCMNPNLYISKYYNSIVKMITEDGFL